MSRLSETWEQYRAGMLEETSRFIEWGLRHPELVTWIPAKPVDGGGFPRRVADWFWQTVLSAGADDAIQTWRQRLLHRPRIFPWGGGVTRVLDRARSVAPFRA